MMVWLILKFRLCLEYFWGVRTFELLGENFWFELPLPSSYLKRDVIFE
jgi:hypothetical protein